MIPFEVPPLRERREDIPLLAAHFVAELSAEYGRRTKQMSPEAFELLKGQPWAGNVRELRNIIERLVIMTPGDRIEVHDVPAPLLAGARAASQPSVASGDGPDFPSIAEAREDFERRYIWRKYQECGGNMSRTAEALQLERSHLYRKMKGYSLLPARRKESA